MPESKSVLDNTAVHPESYDAAKALLELTGHTLADVKNGAISDLPARLGAYGEEKAAEEIGVGVPTLRDIVSELLKPGRDVRDELPKPILRTDVLEMKDLKPGMILTGTVRNVIDFGVFVDIGVHQDGLVHISEIADRYVKHPSQVLSVGDGAFRKKSEAKMREIIQGGATTILVSHSIEQVRSLCSKVLWLHKGEQIAFGAAEPLCDLYQQFLDKKVTIQQVRETVSGQ